MKTSTKTMTMAIVAIIAATGLIWTLTVLQPVDAWHSLFATKKKCTNFMKDTLGNTSSQANAMCNKIIPH